MNLYCVFQGDKYIVGRFHKKKDAINYMIDCWFDGMENLKVKTMTGEEYTEYMEEWLKNDKIQKRTNK